MRVEIDGFDAWRTVARQLLRDQISPDTIKWAEPVHGQLSLEFAETMEDVPPGDGVPATESQEAAVTDAVLHVPKTFLVLAEAVACHRDPHRWDFLYRVLWRMGQGERHLLEQTADRDVALLLRMEQAVRLDTQRMKAFVRFQRLGDESGQQMVAWYRPEHRVLRRVAPFFTRRFGPTPWAILTPDESVYWNRRELRYGPGVPATTAPRRQELEALWSTLYNVVFRPTNMETEVHQRDDAVRHWAALPDGATLDALLEDAQRQVHDSVNKHRRLETSAVDYLPARRDLSSLARAAKSCQGCPLHRRATHTVFGQGPPDADIVFVGDQPGDREDKLGHPFVGAAGRFLEEMIQQVGLDRSRVYLTNAVKHFKWEGSARRRNSRKPDAREQAACRPWLEAELAALRPKVLVCLGATAAQSLLGREFRITRQRGELFSTDWAPTTLATHHPSAILRLEPGPVREQMQQDFLDDLKRAAAQLIDLHPVSC